MNKAFKRYHLFGFTGTPIFAANAAASGVRLHLVDAIADKNALPFRIDYVNTIKQAPAVADKKVAAIDTERAPRPPCLDALARHGSWPRLGVLSLAEQAVAYVVAAVGEELGWTSFALPRGSRRAATGALWARAGD